MQVRSFLTNKHVATLLGVGGIVIAVGTVIFVLLEDWTWIDSLYFTVSTITTVGYGDLVVTHDISKLVASFYMLLTVPLLLVAVGLAAEVMYGEHLEKVIEEAHKRLKEK